MGIQKVVSAILEWCIERLDSDSNALTLIPR